MIKLFFGIIILFSLSGCINNPSPAKKDISKIQILNGKLLKEVYIDENFKANFKKIDGKNYETVKITSNGFYPNYTIPKNNTMPCLAGKQEYKNENKNKYCNSIFVKYDIYSAPTDVVANSIVTIFSLGLNVATGTFSAAKTFDKEKFSKVIKSNNLFKKREELLLAYNEENKEFVKKFHMTKDELKNKLMNRVKKEMRKSSQQKPIGALALKARHDIAVQSCKYTSYQRNYFNNVLSSKIYTACLKAYKYPYDKHPSYEEIRKYLK